jgi:16S rRNA (guanine527-N7)-methyltransferase
LDLAPHARSTIDGHVRLLLAWNAAINLTAIRDPAAIAVRHVVDSLTGLAVLRGRDIDRFLDLGSGGGFPGIPLAAALPADRALLVDSIAKKARFLTMVVGAVGLEERVAVEADRAEALAASNRDRGRWPAVTARAVGTLADLVEQALPLLAPGGCLIAWKRGSADDAAGLGGELAAANRALRTIDPEGRIRVEPAIPGRPGILADLADHRLVLVERGARPIDRSWPRDPAARRRRPW